MKTPIAIEYGPTPHDEHLVKVDGVLLGTPHGKPGAALEAAKAEQARLQAEPDNRGVPVTLTRRYFQVVQSKGGELPKRTQKPLDELTVAEVSALNLDKLEAAIDTGAYDDSMDELLALERVKAKPRAGAIKLLEGEIAELADDARVAAAHAAYKVEHDAELAVLGTDQAELLAGIEAGLFDEQLTALTQVEAEGQTGQPRQAVLDALSDRSVAAAAEVQAASDAANEAEMQAARDRHAAKFADEIGLLAGDAAGLITALGKGAHDDKLEILGQLESEADTPRQDVLEAITARTQAALEAAAKDAS